MSRRGFFIAIRGNAGYNGTKMEKVFMGENE